jgi:hypothetical protein
VLIDVSRCWFNKKGMTIEILNNKNKHFTDLDFILQTLYLFHTNRPPDKREKTFGDIYIFVKTYTYLVTMGSPA